MYDIGCKVKVKGTPKNAHKDRCHVKKDLIGKIGEVLSYAACNTPTLYVVKIEGKEYAMYEDEIDSGCGERAFDSYLCFAKCPVDKKSVWCCVECDNEDCPKRCSCFEQTRERGLL